MAIVMPEVPPIVFPSDIDARAVLLPTRHSAWRQVNDKGIPVWTQSGADYRRAVTRNSPTLFALTYFPHLLAKEGTDLFSFSTLHMDLARAGRRWTNGEPALDGWVAGRRGGKSIWLYVILPLWLLAHGHKRFFLAFSAIAKQSVVALANVMAELNENELLLADFPELRLMRGHQSLEGIVRLEGGASIAARGIRETSAGIRDKEKRPDFTIADDIDKAASDYSEGKKKDNVDAFVQNILPMGSPSSVVQITGTTTMIGAMAHDIVRAALGESPPDGQWVHESGFTPHYYPALITDPETGEERSMWEEGWSTPYLLEMREKAPQRFYTNYQNRPDLAGTEGYFLKKHIRHDSSHWRQVYRWIVYIDPAVTNGPASDQSAVVMAGMAGQHVVIGAAEAGRWPGDELRSRVHRLIMAVPNLDHIWVEGNQGGDYIMNSLRPLPRPVKMDVDRAGPPKRVRIEDNALKHYQCGRVIHHEDFEKLEDQMLAWSPTSKSDDLIDAVSGAIRMLGVR